MASAAWPTGCSNDERTEIRQCSRHHRIQLPHAGRHPHRRRLLAPAQRTGNRPGADHRPLRQGLPACRRVLRCEPVREPLGRTDSRGRGEALRSQPLRDVPERDAVDGPAGADAPDLRMGDVRAGWLGPACLAQQPHRSLHRRPGAGGGELAADARRRPVRRDVLEPRDAGQPHLLPLQPDGAVHHPLHGVLRKPHRPALGDQRAHVRRLRAGRRGVRQLPRNKQAERLFQCAGGHQPRRQVPFLRRGGERVHAVRRSLRIRDQAARGGGERRRPHPRGGGGDRGQRGRRRRRHERPGAGALHHRAHPSRPGRAHARGLRPGGPRTAGLRLHRSPCDRHRGGRPHRRQRDLRGVRRLRSHRAAQARQREEQHRAHGSRGVPLRAAQGAPDDRAAHVRADLAELPGAEPGDRLRELPHAGADGVRAVPGPPRRVRHQLVRIRGGQRTLRGAGVPAAATTDLVSAAGAGCGLHDSPVGAYARRIGRERASAAALARGAGGGPLHPGRQSRPSPYPFRHPDRLCGTRPGGADRGAGRLRGRPRTGCDGG